MKARVFLITIGLLGGLAFFQNCAVDHPDANAIEQTKSLHASIKADCTSCHSAQFDVTTHRPTDGRDCSWCHVATAWKPGDFQLDGVGHKPLAKSCLACHAFESPTIGKLPDGQAPTADHYGGQDCILCHEPNHDKFMFLHTEAHGALVASCLECHTPVGQTAHAANPEYFQGSGSCQTCHQNPASWR